MSAQPNYLKEIYRDIEVSWLSELDGGGRSFGQAYLQVVKEMFGKVGRAYEFCSGPAFIGFSLLAEGLCESLCLSDINPKAVAAVQDTINRHGLQDRVQVYLSDGLSAIPASEKWDLVVSNPPHFEVSTEEEYTSNIRLNDQHWRIHEEFYANVEPHLTERGSILMQENHLGSEASTFAHMVAGAGLETIDSFMCQSPQRGILDVYFYIWIQRQGGDLRMRRESHPRFVFNEPEKLALSTASELRPALALSSWKQYRIQAANSTAETIPIVVYQRRYGLVWRQLLCPIMTVAPASSATSAILRFGPGTYQVRGGSTVLANLTVAA